MTNQDYTKIVAILDRSGSMLTVKTDTEGAFDAYVEKQREGAGKCDLTLVQFNTRTETIYTDTPIMKVPPLMLEPSGMTALHDAIGETVTKLGQRLRHMEEDERPAHVIIVILSDGLENSSKEWKNKLKPLIQQQTDDYGWTFLYLGANQDAILVGLDMGIAANSSLTYSQDFYGATMDVASAATTRAREGTYKGFTEEERKRTVSGDPK